MTLLSAVLPVPEPELFGVSVGALVSRGTAVVGDANASRPLRRA
ncbi:hypothetical protein P0W64_16570 [Tsukamurella sp. 8F]|nr:MULTISPECIES: hypothetical protein [unclassified Tsukamurella]MDF0531150.1 hypothetical protein [Tsukamurella sp. 8J]MDF0588396.1 hypothetical protein [Tsukamurella sp. 8F]